MVPEVWQTPVKLLLDLGMQRIIYVFWRAVGCDGLRKLNPYVWRVPTVCGGGLTYPERRFCDVLRGRSHAREWVSR